MDWELFLRKEAETSWQRRQTSYHDSKSDGGWWAAYVLLALWKFCAMMCCPGGDSGDTENKRKPRGKKNYIFHYTRPSPSQEKREAQRVEIAKLKSKAKSAGVDKFLLADAIDSPGFRVERGFESDDIKGVLCDLIAQAEEAGRREEKPLKTKNRRPGRSPTRSPSPKPSHSGRSYESSPWLSLAPMVIPICFCVGPCVFMWLFLNTRES
jgi:hypothetical protein